MVISIQIYLQIVQILDKAAFWDFLPMIFLGYTVYIKEKIFCQTGSWHNEYEYIVPFILYVQFFFIGHAPKNTHYIFYNLILFAVTCRL